MCAFDFLEQIRNENKVDKNEFVEWKLKFTHTACRIFISEAHLSHHVKLISITFFIYLYIFLKVTFNLHIQSKLL